MNHYYIYILLISVFLGINSTSAQDNCIIKLNNAEKLFEKGNIEEIPEMLSTCIESGFNREDKTKALRLLTLVYLSDDNTLKAEQSLLKLLANDPEFKTNSAIDPVEFIRLFNSFNTSPIFSIGVIGGTNITTPHLIETFSRNSVKEANPKYSSSGVGVSVGLRGTYHINNTIDISLEPTYSYLSFSVEENVTQSNTTNINEVMNIIELPVLGSYYFFKKNNLELFGEIGLSYSMLLSGSLDGKVYYNNGLPDINPPSIQSNDIRKKSNLSGIIGTGAKIDLNRSNLQINLRYYQGVINATNTDMRYSDYQGLNSEYLFIDNDFLINKFSLLVSYNWEFYIHNKKPNNRSNYEILK